SVFGIALWTVRWLRETSRSSRKITPCFATAAGTIAARETTRHSMTDVADDLELTNPAAPLPGDGRFHRAKRQQAVILSILSSVLLRPLNLLLPVVTI